MKIETVNFNLRRMMENVENWIAGSATSKGLQFATHIDSRLDNNLRGDPLRLAQVLINYATNAIKFTQEGTITLRAQQISDSETHCRVHFEVEDTGIGIDPTECARLFEPFQQLDTSTRQLEGTGLGLAICKQLAAIMDDAEVGVISTTGKGSTFWLNVTLEKSDNSSQQDNEPVAPNLSPPPLNNAHILLVENNIFNQQIVAELLENAGASVCIANNEQVALDTLLQKQFDCVLMDIQPVLNCVETTRRIRTNPALSSIPIIGITARTSKKERESCLSTGMDDFIGKPFMPEEFYGVVAKWLPVTSHHSPATTLAQTRQFNNASNIIDFSILAEIIGNNHAQMHEFAQKFLNSARQDLSQVESALQARDWANVRQLGHHIKGAARMVGASELAKLCLDLEKYSRGKGNFKKVQRITHQIHEILFNINEQLNLKLTETDRP